MDYNKMNTKNTLETAQDEGNKSHIDLPGPSEDNIDEKPKDETNNINDITIKGSNAELNPSSIHVEQPNSSESTSKVNMNTLDESVLDTLVIIFLIKKRDLKRILHKIEYVLLPRFSAVKGKELQNWDMWGPLLICTALCVILSTGPSESTNTFVIIFAVVWIGGLVITINSQFLGAKISVFQIICLLGYCIFPIDIAALIIRLAITQNFIKVIVVGVAFLWACLSSIGFVSGLVVQEKKMITVYPIFLFFLALSWFVLNL